MREEAPWYPFVGCTAGAFFFACVCFWGSRGLQGSRKKESGPAFTKEDIENVLDSRIEQAIEKAFEKGKEQGREEMKEVFDRFDQRVEERDRKLMEHLREVTETKQLLAAAVKKKPWYKKIFQ